MEDILLFPLQPASTLVASHTLDSLYVKQSKRTRQDLRELVFDSWYKGFFQTLQLIDNVFHIAAQQFMERSTHSPFVFARFSSDHKIIQCWDHLWYKAIHHSNQCISEEKNLLASWRNIQCTRIERFLSHLQTGYWHFSHEMPLWTACSREVLSRMLLYNHSDTLLLHISSISCGVIDLSSCNARSSKYEVHLRHCVFEAFQDVWAFCPLIYFKHFYLLNIRSASSSCFDRLRYRACDPQSNH